MKKLLLLTSATVMLLLATSIEASNLAFETNNQIQKTLGFNVSPNNKLTVSNTGDNNAKLYLKYLNKGQDTTITINNSTGIVCQVVVEGNVICSRGPGGCYGYFLLKNVTNLSTTMQCTQTGDNTVMIANT